MEPNFFKYLKKSGRTDDVAERVVRLVNVFSDFLLGRKNTTPDHANESDLDAFITFVDKEQANLPKHDDISPSAKSYLWAIRYYYRFIENPEMERYAALLREARIKRKPFALKDFRGVDYAQIDCLASAGIRNTNQMLKAGKTHQMRQQLAEKIGVPEQAICELVRLSDLARIPGIKGIRARLYHDAGIDSIEKMARMEVEEILAATAKFVAESGFDGVPPLPAEVRHSIATAKKLPKIANDL
jgi:hypothetical protein